MITLNQETIDAFSESGFEPVVHVTIDITESDASHTYLRGHNYSGALASTVEGDHIVSTCEVVAPSIDAFERTTEIGNARVEYFMQDVFRSMMNAGKKFLSADLTVRLGAPSLALNRYVIYFNGYIDKVETTDQTVFITAKEYVAKISERMNLTTFVDDHPIEVIKQLLLDSGVPSGKIDTTTFVHDAFSTISHYAYSSRGASYGEDTYEPDEAQVSSVDGHHNHSLNPEGAGPGSGMWQKPYTFAWRLPPADFISEVCKMMRVSMVYDSAQSEYKLVQFNSAASAVRHFTVDDYTDFEKKDSLGPYNRTEIQVGNTGVSTKLTLQDATSVANYGEHAYSNTSTYLSPCSFYIDQTDAMWGTGGGGPDANKVYIGQGFAGTRDIIPEGSQPAASKISSSNPFYGLWRQEIIKCTSPHNPDDGGYEWQKMYDKNGLTLREHTAVITGASKALQCKITATAHGFQNDHRVKITAVSGMTQLNGNTYTVTNRTENTFELKTTNSLLYSTYTSGGVATRDPAYLEGDFMQTFNHMQLVGITRAFGGTQGSATDAQSRGMYDVTAAYDFSQYVLTRFSNGAPEIEFFAPLHHIDIELGDLITIDHDTFLDVGLVLDGLDSNVKFEITGKEIHALGDAIGIQFTAVYAIKTSAPGTSIAIIKPPGYLDSEYIGGVKFGTLRENSSTNSVKDGLNISAGSGLVANIAAGESNFGGKVRALPAQASLTMTASKHTYIGINGVTGRLITTEVATSAAEPTIAPNEIRLGKVVTDGSAITSVADLRQFGNVSVGQINPQAVKPGENLIWNPSFDIWPNPGLKPTGWTIDSGVLNTDIFRSSSGTHSGLYRVRMVDTATVATMSSKKVPINLNRPHRASAWVFQDDSHAITLKIFWWKSDRSASSTASTTIYSASPTDSEWVNISGVASPPSDAVFASLEISRAANPGDEGMWDDVFLGEEPVSFSAYGAATAAPGTKGVFQVKYNQESHDYGGNYDHSGSAYDFEAPGAGTYEFSAAVQGVYVGAFTYLRLMFYKNGAVIKEIFGGARTTGTLEAFAAIESGPIELAKGDLITVHMHPEIQTSYTLNTGTFQTWFSGRKIS